MTPVEYKLLATLAKNAGRVLTHQQLLKEVWGPRYATQKAVPPRVHRAPAQQARARAGAAAVPWLTDTGVGYRLKAE